MQCLPKIFMGARDKFYGRAGYVDDPIPNIVPIAVWVPACIVWLYYASRRIFTFAVIEP